MQTYTRIWKTVDEHSAYNFPFSPFNYLHSENARRHDFHHTHFNAVYGSFFTVRGDA